MRQPERGNEAFVAAVGRMIRATGRRVAQGDVEAFAELVALRDVLALAIDDAACGLVATGYSATEVGRVLGITRQAAWKRYTSRKKAP